MSDNDDIFIFEDEDEDLDEGKAVGTAPFTHLVYSKHAGKKIDKSPSAHAKRRKHGQTVGKRIMDKVQAETGSGLLSRINRYEKGEIDADTLRSECVEIMRQAWRDVFSAGLRAGGVKGNGPGEPLVHLTDADTRWLRSAIRHEMRFFNKFMDAVVNQTYKMPIPQRVGMYVKTLTSCYDSARVMAMPVNSMFHWTGPNDDKTCPSCKYLFANSPYTKLSLPTTPRAGMTLCLCFTDRYALIQTERGPVTWDRVQQNDMVLTHTGNYRRVIQKVVNQSTPDHRYAIVVTPAGIMGFTYDHLLFTDRGFRTAQDAAVLGLYCLMNNQAEVGLPALELSVGGAAPLTDAINLSVRRHSTDPIITLAQNDLPILLSRLTQPNQFGRVRIGSTCLLESRLPVGSPLYDLVVECDHSFVVNGMQVHNSNCRDKLLIRRVTPGQFVRNVREQHVDKMRHIRALRRIKRTGR